MNLKYSVKQLLRTPLKTILFVLLISISVAFLAIGLNLWNESIRSIKEIENSFKTIGTIEQKNDAVAIGKLWNSAKMRYEKYDYPTYSRVTCLSEISGLPYLETPEKREVYTAYVPQLNPAIYGKEMDDERQSFMKSTVIFEFEPIETYDVTQKKRVKITKWIYNPLGAKLEEKVKDVTFFSQDESLLSKKKTIILKKGKKYVAQARWEILEETEEITLYGFLAADGIGGLRPDLTYSGPTPPISEVTENFYSTKEGQLYKEECVWLDRMNNSIPVQPTKNHNLLMPFFDKEARITSGREITSYEYNSHAMVCLVPAQLASCAGIAPGDKIKLSLFEINRSESSSQLFVPSGDIRYTKVYTKDNKNPSIFDEPTYEIVGVYSYYSTTSNPSGYELGRNTVIIPAGSVKNINKGLVSSVGPMQGYTTSFAIKNGTADQFMTEFFKLEQNNIDIKFYDKGYTVIMNGLKGVQLTAFIIACVSALVVFLVICLFIYLETICKKRDIGIKLSLGAGKNSCVETLLLNTMLVVTAGCTFGSAGGSMLLEAFYKLIIKISSETMFNNLYSSTVNAADKISATAVQDIGWSPLILTIIVTSVLCVSLVVTAVFARRIMRLQPIKLLNEKEV